MNHSLHCNHGIFLAHFLTFLSAVSCWSDRTSSLGRSCKDRGAQGACSLWSWLVLHEGWWAGSPLVLHFLSLQTTGLLCLRYVLKDLAFLCPFPQQHRLRGMSIWGRDWVSVPYRESTVGVREMAAARHISARAVGQSLGTSCSNYSKWVSSTLIQKGERWMISWIITVVDFLSSILSCHD